MLGLAGAPAAGKSTLAAELASGYGAVVVGLDGWHLANSALDELDRLDGLDGSDGVGRRARKGAPDTFDAAGYVAFLDRVRDRTTTVWAPEFRREIEEPVAGAIAVDPDVDLVITEGNYLLLDAPPWDRVRPLLDEVWFLAPDEGVRRERLVARHRRFGRSDDEAAERADGSDAANARLVASTADRADLVLRDP